MNKSSICAFAVVVLVMLLLQLESIVAQSVNENEISERNLADHSVRGRGWVQSAQQMIAGPAGQMVVHMAKELISRSAGNSQVLSLNLTNLLILVMLKALIFAAGLIGAGNWSQYARGRSIDNDSLFNRYEAPLYIGFLAAQGSGQDGCLQRAACESPETAADYLKAAKAVMTGSAVFNPKIQSDSRYIHLVQTFEQATLDGMEGAPCDMIYSCVLP